MKSPPQATWDRIKTEQARVIAGYRPRRALSGKEIEQRRKNKAAARARAERRRAWSAALADFDAWTGRVRRRYLERAINLAQRRRRKARS